MSENENHKPPMNQDMLAGLSVVGLILGYWWPRIHGASPWESAEIALVIGAIGYALGHLNLWIGRWRVNV